jgi:signal transduction histidine kinase
LAKTAIANRQLEREAQDRYTALEQSRRRLLSAVDEERARLEAELRGGAQRELEHAAKILRDLPDGGGALATRLAASQQVIHEFARGVHPRALTEAGLSAALAELTSAAADPVTAATVPEGRFPRDVETAAYFICAEALANATKYANASRVDMLIYVEDDQLIVDIKDDGCGGADPSRGSGLRGLADRVDVLRGTLAVTSSPGAGTRVRAVLPLNAAAPAAEADTAR